MTNEDEIVEVVVRIERLHTSATDEPATFAKGDTFSVTRAQAIKFANSVTIIEPSRGETVDPPLRCLDEEADGSEIDPPADLGPDELEELEEPESRIDSVPVPDDTWTVPHIRVWLTEHEIPHSANAVKAELLQLVPN